MPELPEMENYKNLLSQRINGRAVTEVIINREKSVNESPNDFIGKVAGQKVRSIERRAKHLLFYLENGYILLLHLMLSGWLFYGMEEEKPDRTVQIQLSFGNQHLYFIGCLWHNKNT